MEPCLQPRPPPSEASRQCLQSLHSIVCAQELWTSRSDLDNEKRQLQDLRIKLEQQQREIELARFEVDRDKAQLQVGAWPPSVWMPPAHCISSDEGPAFRVMGDPRGAAKRSSLRMCAAGQHSCPHQACTPSACVQ